MLRPFRPERRSLGAFSHKRSVGVGWLIGEQELVLALGRILQDGFQARDPSRYFVEERAEAVQRILRHIGEIWRRSSRLAKLGA
jgi:hypothetical protein